MMLPARRRRGFISMLTFVLLVIMGIIGVTYWLASRLTTDQIVRESLRIKARNLAQAGIEKVRVNIMNQYTLGIFDVSYPGKYNRGRTDQEYAVDFGPGDGCYKVESVKPYEMPGSGKKASGLDYVKNRVKIGVYDIWDVTVVGEVPGTGISARMRTLVKVIRSQVQY